jgi:hypothetical protein
MVADDDACDPLDDSCPAGMYCQYGAGELRCLDEGHAERDANCEPEMCQRGSICMPASELYGPACQQPCDLEQRPWSVCDNGRHTCFAAKSDAGVPLDFGVCRYTE